MRRVAAHPVNVLRLRNLVVGGGATATLQKRVACQGFSKLWGSICFASAPTPAAGYPRVVQYSDQASSAGPTHVDQLSGVVNADGSVTYDINVDVYCPYIGIEYVDGSGGGVTISEAQAELRGSG